MISCIVAPFMLVLMLYAVFLTYVALRAVHPSLGQWKAVAAILLQAAVFALVAFLLSRFFS
jgi:hypothetical protein